MATFRVPLDALALPMCGDDKRCVHFRVVHNMTPTGIECQFGFTEYLYSDKDAMWHAQHNNAFVPISEWAKLVSYTEHVDAVVKRNADHLASKKSNADCEENETMPAKPIRKLDEWIPQPNPIQTLDETVLRQYGFVTGSGPTGR